MTLVIVIVNVPPELRAARILYIVPELTGAVNMPKVLFLGLFALSRNYNFSCKNEGLVVEV